jgi:hypothetical protein
MGSASIRRKQVRSNKAKLVRAKSVPRSVTETKALQGAIDFVLTEAEILKALRRVKGKGRIIRPFGP